MDSALLDKFASIPGVAMKDITPDTSASSTPSDKSALESEIFETGNHTETGTASDFSASASTPGDTTDKKESVTIGKVIGGESAVDMVNAFIPSLLVALFYSVGFQFKKEHWELNAKEKKMLAIPVQSCLDTIVIDFSNPWVNLSIVAGLIYGSKFMDRIPAGIERVKRRPQMPPAKVVPMEQPQPVRQEPVNHNNHTVAPTDFGTGQPIQTERINLRPNDDLAEVTPPVDSDPEYRDEDWNIREQELIRETARRRGKGKKESVKWLKGKKKLPIFSL